MALYRFLIFVNFAMIVICGGAAWSSLHRHASIMAVSPCILAVVTGAWQIYAVGRKITFARQLIREGELVSQPVTVKFLSTVMGITGVVTYLVLRHLIKH